MDGKENVSFYEILSCTVAGVLWKRTGYNFMAISCSLIKSQDVWRTRYLRYSCECSGSLSGFCNLSKYYSLSSSSPMLFFASSISSSFFWHWASLEIARSIRFTSSGENMPIALDKSPILSLLPAMCLH